MADTTKQIIEEINNKKRTIENEIIDGAIAPITNMVSQAQDINKGNIIKNIALLESKKGKIPEMIYTEGTTKPTIVIDSPQQFPLQCQEGAAPMLQFHVENYPNEFIYTIRAKEKSSTQLILIGEGKSLPQSLIPVQILEQSSNFRPTSTLKAGEYTITISIGNHDRIKLDEKAFTLIVTLTPSTKKKTFPPRKPPSPVVGKPYIMITEPDPHIENPWKNPKDPKTAKHYSLSANSSKELDFQIGNFGTVSKNTYKYEWNIIVNGRSKLDNYKFLKNKLETRIKVPIPSFVPLLKLEKGDHSIKIRAKDTTSGIVVETPKPLLIHVL
jgi:hypothetical protein